MKAHRTLFSTPSILVLFVSLFCSTTEAATIYARQSGDWDQTNRWSTVSPGGASCSCTPAVGDSVVIDGYRIDIDANTGNVTVATVYITNDRSSDGRLRVEDGRTLTVTGNLWAVAEDEGDDVDVEIRDNNSTIDVQGNVTFTRVASNDREERLRLNIEDDNTSMNVTGNFTFNWLDADEEEGDEIQLEDEGQLNVSGNVLINKDGGQDSDGDSFTADLDDDAQWNVTGNFDINHIGNYDVTIDIDDDASLNITGNLTATLSSGDDLRIRLANNSNNSDPELNVTGNVTLDHNGATGGDDLYITIDEDASVSVGGTITMDCDANNSDRLYIRMDEDAILDVESHIFMNAVTDGRVEIEMNDDTYLYIAGNFTRQAAPNNYGILDCDDDATVVYDGSTAQIVAEDAGAGSDDFYYEHVQINNTFGTIPQLATEGLVTIHNSLTLTDGIVQTTAANIIVIPDNVTSTEGSSASFVSGPMRKIGNDNFVFPVGKGSRWARIAIASMGGGGSSTIEGEYFNEKYVNTIDMEPGLNNVSTIEHWVLERTAGAKQPTVTLYWENAATSVITDLSPAAFSVVRFDDATDNEWKDHSQQATTGGVGPGVAGTVTANGTFNEFGPFTFGSGNGNNILPIELTDFEAGLVGDIVELTWETASEYNNDYFTVERSADGLNFNPIGTVEATGNSQTASLYNMIDQAPLYGLSYYRLKQTDLDGKFEYTAVVTIRNDVRLTDQPIEIKVYPNPAVSGSPVNIEFTNTETVGQEILVVVLDITGRQVFSNVVVQEHDKFLTAIDPNQKLAPGVYVVLGSNSLEVAYQEKLIIVDPGSSAAAFAAK